MTKKSIFSLTVVLIIAYMSLYISWVNFPAPGVKVFDDQQPAPAAATIVPLSPPLILPFPQEIPPSAVLPEEPVVMVPPPMLIPEKKPKKIRRRADPLDAPYRDPKRLKQHDESETMHPSRSYCIRTGNPKTGNPMSRVCLERDEITKKVYRTS